MTKLTLSSLTVPSDGSQSLSRQIGLGEPKGRHTPRDTARTRRPVARYCGHHGTPLHGLLSAEDTVRTTSSLERPGRD